MKIPFNGLFSTAGTEAFWSIYHTGPAHLSLRPVLKLQGVMKYIRQQSGVSWTLTFLQFLLCNNMITIMLGYVHDNVNCMMISEGLQQAASSRYCTLLHWVSHSVSVPLDRPKHRWLRGVSCLNSNSTNFYASWYFQKKIFLPTKSNLIKLKFRDSFSFMKATLHSLMSVS